MKNREAAIRNMRAAHSRASRKPYGVLCADPPWMFGDKLPGPKRGAQKHYDVMSVEDICRFSLPALADDAYLFLWRVSAMVEEAYQVCRAWGFEPKSEIVWRKVLSSGKVHFGMGRTTRGSHETCIIAVRGKPHVKNHSTRSIFDAAPGKHSQKPEAFYDIIENLCEGPYVELFARRNRPGWACLGNEL